MAKKDLPKAILIVCEGTNTEPNYFQGIKEHLKQNGQSDYAITISPKPTLDAADFKENQERSKHKTKRKKRQLRGEETVEIPTIEPEYKAVPVRYVREAQKGLESGVFEEAWAVFDQDGHPKHKEAFALAEEKVDGKQVQIAFSSISFEHWVLLHFEKSNTIFPKSQHCIDYLQSREYTANYEKSRAYSPFKILFEQLNIAMENASWLRFKSDKAIPIYERNPYTDIDKLVVDLSNISHQYYWTNWNEAIEVEGWRITFKKEDNLLQILFENISEQAKIIPEDCSFIRNLGTTTKSFSSSKRLLNPNDEWAETIDITEYLGTIDNCFCLKLDEQKIIQVEF